MQQALERSDLDALVFFKAEAVRYLTDFYVKGFRPFMEPEYWCWSPGQAARRRLHLGQRRAAHPHQVRYRRRPPPARGRALGGDAGRHAVGLRADARPHRHRPHAVHGPPGADEAVPGARDRRRVEDLGADHGGQAPQGDRAHSLSGARRRPRHGCGDRRHSARRQRACGVGGGRLCMRKNGSEFEPFIPLVASGYNTSMFERVATEKVIEAGEMVILDIGAVVRGYTGDLGRTFMCGEPTPEQKAVYKATHLALQEAKKVVRPGATGWRSTAAPARSSTSEGWGNYVYTGNTGHQLGYGLHGEPLVDRNGDFEIVENMVICLEPRIVLPDRPDIGGAHLEDVVVVTKQGHEQINRSPFDEKLLY